MSETENLNQKNQKFIVETLSHCGKSLSLFELKKKTNLANLYFFKALEILEQQGAINRVKREGVTWIILKESH